MDDGLSDRATPVAVGRTQPLLAAGVLATSCGFALVARGITETFSVFLLPLEAHFGFERATLTGIYALAMLTAGIVGPLTGILLDRLGPRRLYAFGVFMVIVAFVGASAATELWHLQATLGLCVGLSAASLGSAAQAPLLARWFKGRIGTTLGLVGGAGGIGILLFAPLSQNLIDTVGWRGAYLGLAAIASILIVPLVLLPWTRMTAGAPTVGPRRSLLAGVAILSGGSGRSILRNPLLAAMFATYLLTCTAVFAVQVLIVGFFVDAGYSPIVAATVVGLSGLATSVGMALFGWLSDRLGYLTTLSISYVATGLGLAVLTAMMWAPSPWLLGLHVVTFGLALGSRGPLTLGLAARHFPGPDLGRVSGTLLLAFGLGSAFGAWLGGALHDWTGGYGAALATAAACIAAAMLPWWAVPRLRHAAR